MEYDFNGPTADSLPMEIISRIMEYLPSIEDRKAAAMVCRRWYDVYQTPALRKREEAVINLNQVFEQLYLIDNPDRVFTNVSARGVNINRNTRRFWWKYSEHIKSLSINGCEISETIFVKILSKCTSLETLRVHDCRELFISGLLLESESERDSLRPVMANVKSLSLGYNRYLSDLHFSRLISVFPNLQELLLPGCYISYHTVLYNRFYQNGHSIPSDNVFTFSYIHEYIKSNASRLKSLSFAETLIDGHATRALAVTKNLVLNKLELRGCVQVTSDAVMVMSEYQKSLTHLDLGLCPRLNDDALLTICARLKGLKFLSIRGCRGISDIGIADIWKLNVATSFNVSECERLSDEGLLIAFGMRENLVLEELRMSHLPLLTDRAIGKIIANLPNLRLFDVSHCHKAVTDRAIQSISLKAKHLNSLILTMNDKMTDRGTTGIALEVSPNSESVEARMRAVMERINGFDLPEEHPVMIEYKALVKEISPGSDLRGGSIGLMKTLTYLSLSGCARVTDFTLKFGLKLPCLRILDLSNCQLITANGLRYLNENTKVLEVLSLDNCNNVDDVGVGHVLQTLRRLKSLTLGSKKISNRILDHLGRKVGNLKFLDLRHCQQLSAATVNSIIAHYPTLQVVHFSTKANDSQDAPAPPPPPPPPMNQPQPQHPFPMTLRPLRIFPR